MRVSGLIRNPSCSTNEVVEVGLCRKAALCSLRVKRMQKPIQQWPEGGDGPPTDSAQIGSLAPYPEFLKAVPESCPSGVQVLDEVWDGSKIPQHELPAALEALAASAHTWMLFL